MDENDTDRGQRLDNRYRVSLLNDFGSFQGVQLQLDTLGAQVAQLEADNVRLADDYGNLQARMRALQKDLTASSGPKLYARYAAEITAAAVEAVSLGKMTVHRMTQYSHASFVDGHCATEAIVNKTAPTFFQMIRSTYELVVQAASSSSSASSSSAAASSSSSSSSSASSSVPSPTTAMVRIVNRCVAATINSALTASKSSHQSVIAFLTGLNVLAATRSPLAADMIADAMCGGVSAQTINSHFYALVDEQLKQRVLPSNSETKIVAHDNNCTNYTPSSSRSGISANQLNKAMVWTNREEFAYRRVDSVEKSIQFDPKFNPKNSKVYKSTTSADWRLTVFGYVPPTTTTGFPDETLEDQNYINNEIVASLMFVYDQEDYFNECPEATDLGRPSIFVEPPSSGSKRSSVGAEAEFCVPCLYCDKYNKKGTINCKWCSFKLRSIDAVRQDAKGELVSVLARKRRPPRARRKMFDEVWGVDAEGRVTRTSIRLNIQTLSCVVEGDGDDDDDDANANNAEGDVEVRRTLLPSLFINPNTSVAIREILLEWGRWYNVAGFADKNTPPSDVLQFLFLVSDLGAADLSAFDDPTQSIPKFVGQNFMCFIFILGVFHECKMWIGIVMDIFFSLGGGDLATFHTYASEAAQGYLRRCGDLHKANDFLRHVVKPALMTAFLREYLHYLASLNAGKAENEQKVFNFDDALEWGYEVCNDVNSKDLKLKNRLFFLLFVLPAYELIKKGVRTGNMAAYHAGRRALLPFVFALGHVKYAPALVRDMIQYYHRVPPEIRKELFTIFGLFDEGINGKVEESNALQKGFVISETERGVQAGALLVNSADTLREVQRNFGAKLPSTQHPKDRRTPTDLARDIKACVGYLVTNRIFARAPLGQQTVARTFKGVVIAESLTVIELWRFGKEKSETWVKSYIRDNKFPPGTRGRSFIPRKTKKSGRIIAEGEDGGAEDDGDELEGVPDEQIATNTNINNLQGEPSAK